MKKTTVYYIGLVVLACLFLLAFNIGIVSADQHDTGVETDTTIVEQEEEVVQDEETPADVLLDEKVTIEDLGVTEVGVLPGSPLHFFKRIGWTFQEILETDPIADAELKIQHANQELAGLKQLIDERGFSEVSPSIINGVMNRFEGRLDNVNNVADALRELKDTDPEAVDELLNNLTDKQFKYQKVLDSIERDVIKVKEEDEDAGRGVENVFIKVTETKDKILEHYGEVLGTVEKDNPEKIAERIIKIADKQEGSEFKHLKNLEVLKRLEGQVPESAQGAIRLAQENTLKFFNRDVLSLPETARAGRFEQYSRFSYGDETRQLSFLDDLKLLDDIPLEILQKIEEIKEFAIAKFEKKISNFDRPEVLDSYMGHLSGENFNDMVIAEQFASRVVFEDNPEIRQRMNEIRDRSVEEFTARFTDPDSQAQIAKFQELERILEQRPGDPKVMRMMQELEAQVRSDPDKSAFIDQFDQLENKMRGEFEEKFRQEGDRYFDRIGTLDPRDFEIYQQFSGEDFLPPGMAEMFLDHGVDQYRDYMRDVDDPNQFDRFNTRFADVPQFVIDEISNRDDGFGDAMQFKRQAMEKLRFEQERQMEIDRQQVDYQERELFHQLDRTRRQADEEFWRSIDSIPYENFDERKDLFEDKRQADLSRLEEENTARLELFNKRLELDPWCDSSCQQIQEQFISQEFRHQKDRIQDDYISQQKQIEFDLSREKQNNPLFGLCDTPESCDAYCQNNTSVPACQGFFYEPVFHDDFDGPKDYDCGPGNYFDFSIDRCVQDPYYIAPTDFTQCPFGSHWEPQGGFCEPDFTPPPYQPIDQPKIDCGNDAYFDFRENRCISYHIGPACSPGFYLGPFGECKQENFQCPDYSASFFGQCPEGQFRDNYIDNNGCNIIGECRTFGETVTCPDLAVMEPFPCPTGSYRGPDVIDYNGCKVFGECVSDGGRPPFCPDIATMFIEPCPEGQYRETVADQNGCKVFGQCVGDLLPPVTCTAYFEGYEYNTSTDRCEPMSTSGCTNPYKYSSLTECQEGNITGTTPSSWVNHTWYFSDGSTSSSILSRTDAEYLNYVAGIEVQCKDISQNSYAWKPGAGDDSISNWQNFGIPDCSGTAVSTNFWCGDGACNSGEDLYNCSIDCGSGTTVAGYCGDNVCSTDESTYSSCPVDCGDTTGSSTYCPSPAYWDSSINGCNWDSSTTNTSVTDCPSPSYWDPAINGCAPGTVVTTCMTASDYGTCDYGYEYDGSGCVIGCGVASPPPPAEEPPPVEETPPPAEEPPLPPAEETPPADEPPPAANVWDAFRALFGF